MGQVSGRFTRQPRQHRQGEKQRRPSHQAYKTDADFRVMADGGRTDDDFYPLAQGLTEENADALISDISTCIEAGVVVYSVKLAMGSKVKGIK